MPIKRHIFDVEYLDDPAATPRVFQTRVITRDKLDVEQNGHKYGLLDMRQQPQLCGLLWLWYSARREGHVPADTSFDTFRERCLDNGDAMQEDVPPTMPGASDGSLSHSPSDSLTSTGSTPPATTTGS